MSAEKSSESVDSTRSSRSGRGAGSFRMVSRRVRRVVSKNGLLCGLKGYVAGDAKAREIVCTRL